MCGIAGIVRFDGAVVDAARVESMATALTHRGPDAGGLWTDGRAALGHRRLSIIDLSTSAEQPMANEDGSVLIVFNGEIYNFRELRAQLVSRGHTFTSDGDTEVILHLYEERGPAVVEDLVGMFAFAIWDAGRRRLVLARDRVGKKPLYYHVDDGAVCFASELQGLMPCVRWRRPDVHAIHDFLTLQYVPGEATAFEGVRRLPPATVAVFDRSPVPRLRTYWSLDYTAKMDVSEKEAVQRLDELLLETTRSRMIADVPLGAFLSGGIDSSLVVAAMARSSAAPVKTFSVGFSNKDFDELPYARAVAERYGTDHTEVILEPDNMQLLRRLVRHFGEPFADSSALATYAVAEATRRGVTVALTGDGGDEAMAGYERYDRACRRTALDRAGSLAAPLLGPLLRPRRGLPPWSARRRARGVIDAATGGEALRYASQIWYFRDCEKDFLYTPEFRETTAGQISVEVFREALDAASASNAVDRLTALDVATYLPGDILVKVDICSMANSLETRAPFLDHRLLEFAAELPSSLRLRPGQPKYLSRQLAYRLLPHEVIDRPKQGFAVPIRDWLRREHLGFLRDVLLDPRAIGRGYFRREAVEGMIDAHATGKANLEHRLWALLNLELWHREFIDA